MPVLFIGANPGLTLFADDGTRLAFVSVWRVDFSPHGSGTAMIIWYAGRVRIVTATPRLGRWLAEDFTRHFPEVAGLPWPEPEVVEAPVTLDLEPAVGMSATAAGAAVRIGEPLDRRPMTVDAFPGNGLALSNVYTPCRTGTLTLDGVAIPGTPKISGNERPSSTAFLADAEVWTTAQTR